MEAVAWTAIALLGASVLGSFGGFFFLSSKIDARVDALGARLEARIDGVDGRIQAGRTELAGRIDGLAADLGGRIDGLASDLVGRVDALSLRVDTLNARMDDHIGRHAV